MRGYLEIPDDKTLAAYDQLDFTALRKSLFSEIIDQGFPGSKLEDFSLVPRVLPGSYMTVIEEACQRLTEVILRLVVKDQDFLLAHLSCDSRWDKLINKYGVLENVPRRLIGELRYDFAVSGPLTEDNPPRLMEVNAGALGVLVYADFIPKLLKKLVPGLDHLSLLDLGAEFVNLCRRVGPEIINFSVSEYSWGEDVLEDAIHGKFNFHLVNPNDMPEFESWPKLKKASWRFNSGNRMCLQLGDEWREMDGFRWGRILEEGDINKFGDLIKEVVDSNTVFLSHPRTDFVCHKGVLPLLSSDKFLSEELNVPDPTAVSRYVLPSWNLKDIGFPPAGKREQLVLKQNFGCSGSKVFIGDAMNEVRGRVNKPQEWIVQQRIDLNQMYTRMLYCQDRPLRMDLAVFVYFDYVDGKLEYCKVAGLVSRGAGGFRVNLNLGGAGIPVLINHQNGGPPVE